jgi:hypothetical protein
VATTNINPIDQLQSVLYEQGCDISNVYTPRPGVCVLPLAEDPPTDPFELYSYSPVAVLRLHAPYRERRVSYVTNKDSAPPVVPAPVDAGSFKFVGGTIGVHNTLRQDQLGFDWQTVTDYSFVELAVPLPGDGLVLGTPPWIWSPVALAVQSGTVQPAEPTFGSVATAGSEVLYAKGAGDSIDPSSGAYAYQFPSYFPGTFFNNFLVNGGPPTISDPRPQG